MDFGSLPKSALELFTALSLALNFSPSVPAPDLSLAAPALLSSYNIPAAEMQSLDVLEENTDIKLVIKEPSESELVTVEQPTPEIEEKKEPEVEIKIISEAKAETSSPSPSPASTASSGSNSDRLFQMVNEHRAKLGLASFEQDVRLCGIARNRAPQVKGELASGTLHQGFRALNLPYWATENIAAYQTIEENLHFWLTDYIHRVAVEGNHKYSCVACAGSSCSQIFTSFVNK